MNKKVASKQRKKKYKENDASCGENNVDKTKCSVIVDISLKPSSLGSYTENSMPILDDSDMHTPSSFPSLLPVTKESNSTESDGAAHNLEVADDTSFASLLPVTKESNPTEWDDAALNPENDAHAVENTAASSSPSLLPVTKEPNPTESDGAAHNLEVADDTSFASLLPVTKESNPTEWDDAALNPENDAHAVENTAASSSLSLLPVTKEPNPTESDGAAHNLEKVAEDVDKCATTSFASLLPVTKESNPTESDGAAHNLEVAGDTSFASLLPVTKESNPTEWDNAALNPENDAHDVEKTAASSSPSLLPVTKEPNPSESDGAAHSPEKDTQDMRIRCDAIQNEHLEDLYLSDDQSLALKILRTYSGSWPSPTESDGSENDAEDNDNRAPSCAATHNEHVNLNEDLCLSDDSVADPNWEDPERKNRKNNNTEHTTDTDDDSPPKKQKKIKTTRWHLRKENTYHRNKERELRSKCLPYKDYKKRPKAPKAPKIIDCKCRLKCSEKIPLHHRIFLCKTYWAMDYKRQKDFLLANITGSAVQRRLVTSKNLRNISRYYHFYKGEVKIRVCEKFFRGTLCISNGPINKAFAGLGNAGSYDGADLRGKHVPHNKTSQEDEEYVKKHIEAFPTMESHYCRKTSSKCYLESNLSIPKMYELYEEKCSEESKSPVSINVYRRIFCTEFNLDFHKTKKDQCLTCNKYNVAKTSNSSDLAEWQVKYERHIELKKQSQQAKEQDKIKANENDNFNSITMDLQKVLHMPNSNVSLLYYLRKLNVYNATIYEARSPNNGYCFLWNELNGKKGSDEVGTALYLWIKRLPEKVKEISIFTDTCAGQNRNQYLMALMLYLIQTTHLDVIEHKYLESGHSHMEVDSMHSAIEHQLANIPVFSMNDHCNIVRLARSNRKLKKGCEKKKPYEPIIMQYKEILDLKDLKKHLLKNRSVGTENEVIQWLKVKCFRYEKVRPSIVLYRYDYDSDYKELQVQGSKGKDVKGKSLRKRKRSEIENAFNYETYELKKAYDSILPITNAKKKDLLKMCSEKIIPEELHPWYQSLPSKEGKDYLPEDDDPNYEEEEN